jgi:large subunit ribosomal protein L40
MWRVPCQCLPGGRVRRAPTSVSPTITSRLYTTAPKKSVKGKINQADPRLAPLKKAFNPLSRNYRGNLEIALHRAIPSAEAHETIERAWQLHERHRREEHLAELCAMHARMQEAVEELKNVDDRLFHWATVPRDQRRLIKPEAEALRGARGSVRKALEARIEGLFPRELRVPTDTPSTSGWDYDWKPPGR